MEGSNDKSFEPYTATPLNSRGTLACTGRLLGVAARSVCAYETVMLFAVVVSSPHSTCGPVFLTVSAARAFTSAASKIRLQYARGPAYGTDR